MFRRYRQSTVPDRPVGKVLAAASSRPRPMTIPACSTPALRATDDARYRTKSGATPRRGPRELRVLIAQPRRREQSFLSWAPAVAKSLGGHRAIAKLFRNAGHRPCFASRGSSGVAQVTVGGAKAARAAQQFSFHLGEQSAGISTVVYINYREITGGPPTVKLSIS
jgi:hypothetical protein